MHPKIEKAKAQICLDQPFFAALLLRRTITARPEIKTLGVSPKGEIFYAPEFVDKLSVRQVVFGLCHEVMHYASLHFLRRGARDPYAFNLAGDAWINATLRKLGVGEQIPGGVNCEGGALHIQDAENKTVEDIYAELEQMADKLRSSGGGGDLDGDMQSGEQQMSSEERDTLESQIKMELTAASAAARMYGKLPGHLADFVAGVIESKVPWYDILERFMTDRVKSDYSWARPNRRYAPDFYLPAIDGVGAMGEIVVQVDISGSVSRAEIDHYNGHIKRIVELCRPSKTHVIYTDTHVQRHDEFDNAEDVEIKFYSGGGTDMRAGFDWITSHGLEPACVVTLTDGYTPWPESTDVPAIWCISSDAVAPCGESVHFSVEA